MELVNRNNLEELTEYGGEIINPTINDWIEISDEVFLSIQKDKSKFHINDILPQICNIIHGFYKLKSSDVEKINSIRDIYGVPIVANDYQYICVIATDDELMYLKVCNYEK